MTRILLVTLAVVALALWLRSRQTVRSAAAQADPSRIGSPDADRQTLHALRDAGADLTKPTEVNFYLYFPTEAAATAAAAQAWSSSLPTRVVPGAMDSGWLCLASGTLVPTDEAIRAASTRLQAVAAEHGGEYDGWEAAVER